MKPNLRSIVAVSVASVALALLAIQFTRADASPPRAATTPSSANASQADRARLAVHEWGTFTSMQGSSGVELDGMQHEGETLPAFVHSFTRSQPSPFHDFGDHSRNVRVRRTRSKMETPVIYFHTDKAMDVSVKVHFIRGLMSHYFPAPLSITPAPPASDASADERAAIDLQQLGVSSLEWRAHITPDASTRDIPEVAASNHYGFAREVDAAKVQVTSPAGPTESERFLFYRGLGRDNPQILIRARAGGRARIHNGENQVPAAFAIEMTDTQGRFLSLGKLDRNARRDFALTDVPFMARKRAIRLLSKQVFAALVARGLHKDEARAMVRTWADQWFGSSGTRVVYVVPQDYIDRTLPLQIEPTPDELVRVFVGRIEYLTPEEEQRVADALRASGSLDSQVRANAMLELAKLGRFMEPKIRRIAAISRDPVVRDRAAAMLALIERGAQAPRIAQR